MLQSMAVTLTALFVFLLSPSSLCLAQDKALLVNEAKKEKKIVYYTAISLPDAVSLAKGFEARYPGITVEIFRSGSQGLAKLGYKMLSFPSDMMRAAMRP